MKLTTLFTAAVFTVTLAGAALASTVPQFTIDTTAGQGRNAVQVSPVIGSAWSRNPFQL